MGKIKPLGNRILVRRSKAQTSKGGIILPDAAQEKPREGEVIAVGPGKLGPDGKMEELQIHVGERVMFSSYAGTEVKSQGDENEEFLILTEEDVLGVLV